MPVESVHLQWKSMAMDDDHQNVSKYIFVVYLETAIHKTSKLVLGCIYFPKH
ncbi:hypothetical protein X953_17375 [Virgibacillus sp. SK37]|nr:hypothetical protein X953_17375 [Virgibacillus sp. SK37]